MVSLWYWLNHSYQAIDICESCFHCWQGERWGIKYCQMWYTALPEHKSWKVNMGMSRKQKQNQLAVAHSVHEWCRSSMSKMDILPVCADNLICRLNTSQLGEGKWWVAKYPSRSGEFSFQWIKCLKLPTLATLKSREKSFRAEKDTKWYHKQKPQVPWSWNVHSELF